MWPVGDLPCEKVVTPSPLLAKKRFWFVLAICVILVVLWLCGYCVSGCMVVALAPWLWLCSRTTIQGKMTFPVRIVSQDYIYSAILCFNKSISARCSTINASFAAIVSLCLTMRFSTSRVHRVGVIWTGRWAGERKERISEVTL